MCLHFRLFDSLTLIRQSASQFSTATRCSFKFSVAVFGHFERLTMAVSSAKVEVNVLRLVGMSAVYRMHRIGPSTLPWGTPASILRVVEVNVLHLTMKALFLR